MALDKSAVMFAFACALSVTSSYAQNIGDLVGSDASVTGSVVLAGSGTHVISGTSISARDAAASLKLARGGELRICPHSTVSLTASKGGRDLDIGMGTGAIEAHYALASSADTILTPDFRILLPGPGVFHFAIAADIRGNTCVRSLPGNSASLVVTEVLGDGVYQVRSGDQIVFHNGRVSETDPLVPPDCGCGPPKAPVQSADKPPTTAANPAAAAPSAQSPAPTALATQAVPSKPENSPPPQDASHAITKPGPRLGSVPGGDLGLDVAPRFLPNGTVSPESAPPSPPASPETHILVEVPFVFRANEAALPPPPMIATISLSDMPDLLIPTEQGLPPSAGTKSKAGSKAGESGHGGFFSKVGAFVAGIFGRHH
jgi:hypothetical protein